MVFQNHNQISSKAGTMATSMLPSLPNGSNHSKRFHVTFKQTETKTFN